MTKTELLEKIKLLYSKKNKVNIELELENYLKNHPEDIDAWLRLAIVEINPPFADGYRAINAVSHILKYNKKNVKALLIYAYADFYCFGEISDTLYEMLMTINSQDDEEQSLIEFVKAWKFMDKNDQIYEQFLLKSIIYYEKHVYNHKRLSQHYLEVGKFDVAEVHVLQALENVQAIYFENRNIEDYTDVDEFLDGYIKGIYLTKPNFESLEELLENIKKRKAEKI